MENLAEKSMRFNSILIKKGKNQFKVLVEDWANVHMWNEIWHVPHTKCLTSAYPCISLRRLIEKYTIILLILMEKPFHRTRISYDMSIYRRSNLALPVKTISFFLILSLLHNENFWRALVYSWVQLICTLE